MSDTTQRKENLQSKLKALDEKRARIVAEIAQLEQADAAVKEPKKS